MASPRKRALVFLSVTLSVFFPIALAWALSSDLNSYREARGLERVQPDKACEIYQKLSLKKNFVLQDLAFIRQGLVCVLPLSEGSLDLAEKPWLEFLDLQRRRQTALMQQDLPAFTEAGLALARFEKSQKLILKMIDDTEKTGSSFPAEDDVRKQLANQIQRAREGVAPRLIAKPFAEQSLKIAQDFLNAREFKAARKWARRAMVRKGATFDEKLLARKVRRTSFKVENETAAYLNALKDDWKWIRTQSNPTKGLEMGLVYAKALWTDGQVAAAKKILSQAEAKYGRVLKINEIHLVRGKMSEERKDWRAALAYYIKANPLDLRSNLDKKIQFAKAWTAWKLMEYEQSLRELEPLIALGQDDPFESARAQYWKGRVLKRMGKADEAKDAFKRVAQVDPLGYYGALSYHERDEKLPVLKVPKVSSEFQKSPLYDAAYFQALYDVGELEVLQSAAGDVLKKVRPGSPVSDWLPVFLAAAKANSYLPLFSQISTLTPEERAMLLEKDPQLLFPLDFRDVIVTQATRFGLPPELSFSIIRQESAFNPFARSPADAFGLMQILPSVAKSFQKEVGVKIDHFEDLFKPEINVPFGTALLKDLMGRHDGKVFLVAAAYNASEKALRNWQKTRWNDDTIEFIEEIPYEETRAYVKLIIRNFTFYSRLLKSGEPTPFPAKVLGI